MEKLGMDACSALPKALTRNLAWLSLNTTAVRRKMLLLLSSVKDLLLTPAVFFEPAKGTDEMKYDMSGAAAMIAAIATAAAMKLPVNIVAAVGFTEKYAGKLSNKTRRHLEELRW